MQRPEPIASFYRVADRLGLEGPHVEQTHHNLINRRRVTYDLRPFIRERGMGITAYMPLQVGLLTDKYADGIPTGSKVDTLDWVHKQYEAFEPGIKEWRKIAHEIGIDMATMAVAWVLKDPEVSTTIAGASKPEHVERNLKAFNAVPLLTDEVMEKIEAVRQEFF